MTLGALRLPQCARKPAFPHHLKQTLHHRPRVLAELIVVHGWIRGARTLMKEGIDAGRIRRLKRGLEVTQATPEPCRRGRSELGHLRAHPLVPGTKTVQDVKDIVEVLLPLQRVGPFLVDEPLVEDEGGRRRHPNAPLELPLTENVERQEPFVREHEINVAELLGCEPALHAAHTLAGALRDGDELDLELIARVRCHVGRDRRSLQAVSYTHLTLPTIYSV